MPTNEGIRSLPQGADSLFDPRGEIDGRGSDFPSLPRPLRAGGNGSRPSSQVLGVLVVLGFSGSLARLRVPLGPLRAVMRPESSSPMETAVGAQASPPTLTLVGRPRGSPSLRSFLPR